MSALCNGFIYRVVYACILSGRHPCRGHDNTGSTGRTNFYRPPEAPMAAGTAAKEEKYYPSLFARTQGSAETLPDEKQVVPQATLYDMPLRSQHTPQQKHMTVFGFSPQNRENVLSAISKIVSVDRKEEGKNYFSVWSDNTADLERLMELDHTTISGEIVGVFRRNFGPIQDSNIYVKKKGIFGIITEYFFGEQ